MPGGTKTPSQSSVKRSSKRYLTLIFNYEDCTVSSYDTINNFINAISVAANDYNNNRPYSGSARYNLEQVFTSEDRPGYKVTKEGEIDNNM